MNAFLQVYIDRCKAVGDLADKALAAKSYLEWTTWAKILVDELVKAATKDAVARQKKIQEYSESADVNVVLETARSWQTVTWPSVNTDGPWVPER